MIFVIGFLVRIAAPAIGLTPKAIDLWTRAAILGCFLVFGFACIGLMLHVFIALQKGIANGGLPMVRFLSDHVTGVTLAVWAFLGLGTIIALPFALRDMGFEIPIGKSQGILMADIGM